MKKSRKLARLKRVSRCCGCKYFTWLPEDEGLCSRYYDLFPFSKWYDRFISPFSVPCPHYVPRGGFLPDYHVWDIIDNFLDDYLPF